MLQNGAPKNMIDQEFRIYETLYTDLAELGVKEIGLAESAYRHLATDLGR